MPYLVVNADDFGRSAPINKGILEAHKKGIVTSTTLMVTREGFSEAVQMARDTPSLGIGLHLDLDQFFDVEHGVGRLKGYKDASLPYSQIAIETEAQILKIKDTGLPITHMDGHHHVHLRAELIGVIAALASKHKIPWLRYYKGFYEGLYPGIQFDWVPDIFNRFDLRFSDTFFAGWEAVESSLPGYAYFNLDQPFKIAELMVHPGVGEAWRDKELAHCCDPAVRDALTRRGITLTNFANVPN